MPAGKNHIPKLVTNLYLSSSHSLEGGRDFTENSVIQPRFATYSHSIVPGGFDVMS